MGHLDRQSWLRMTKKSISKSRPEPVVFLHLVNRAAFADKVIINVWSGRRRRKQPADLEAEPSRPIGGRPGRVYARSMPLIFHDTGNEADLRYGKLQHWPSIPAFQLVLRSVATPLDEAEVKRALAGLFVAGCRTTISQVEMTFDTVGTSIRFLQNGVLTRARMFRLLRDALGNETLYIGGPRSTWQLRIYQKTPEIVRIEFILRRQRLRDQGIFTYEDVNLLGSLDLHRMASFMDLSRAQLRQALEPLPSGWQKTVNLDWVHRRPLQLLVQTLRRDEHINLEPLLRDSQIQLTLDRMRSEFIWKPATRHCCGLFSQAVRGPAISGVL
jgi:hypothetical protein